MSASSDGAVSKSGVDAVLNSVVFAHAFTDSVLIVGGGGGEASPVQYALCQGEVEGGVQGAYATLNDVILVDSHFTDKANHAEGTMVVALRIGGL